MLGPGRYAVSDGGWALHTLRLQRASFETMSDALPLLRAVKDTDELARMASA